LYLIIKAGTHPWQTIDSPPELEIGYHVHRHHRNQGLATEAARAVRDYAFSTLASDPEIDHVISMIRPENLPSRRVAEKNGFILTRTVYWRGYDHSVYRYEQARRMSLAMKPAPRRRSLPRSTTTEDRDQRHATQLLNASVTYARLILRRYGELAPFAFAIDREGQVARETLDIPRLPRDPERLWKHLTEHIAARIRRGAIQAVALCANVTLDQPSQENYTDALILTIEQEGGHALKHHRPLQNLRRPAPQPPPPPHRPRPNHRRREL
jgi:hypothetical protein